MIAARFLDTFVTFRAFMAADFWVYLSDSCRADGGGVTVRKRLLSVLVYLDIYTRCTHVAACSIPVVDESVLGWCVLFFCSI